ncbi:glycosyltransferase 87 family protein [Saccharothrix variisporea]|uniref:glycosyltransferase 87 family protein n=1 Tax=Saccharothrix variisporea TaxID=543527 RepID=UPI001FE4A1E5|nr:glycosyltransferase 87 family protein [Saccharothrix variisporea]
MEPVEPAAAAAEPAAAAAAGLAVGAAGPVERWRLGATGWRWVVGVGAGLVGVAGAWRALQPAMGVPLPDAGNLAEERMQDFRDALYFPVREFLAGGNPYDPAVMFAHWPVRQNFNLYQPYHLLLHMPFALPGYRVGAVAYAGVLLGLLVLLSVMAAGRARVPWVIGTVVVAALLVTSQVGKAQLYVGQVNPLLAVGAAGALLARTTHPRWAALALALAWLKPQFGLPLAILLCARGSWRVAAGGTGIAAAASAVALVPLVLRDGVVGFAQVIGRNLEHASQTTYGAVDSLTSQRVDVAAVFFRVVGWLPPGSEVVALLAVMVVSVVLVRRLDRSGDDTGAADLLTCVAVVVAVVHQPGDVIIAVPALVAAAVVWWRRRHELRWLGVAVVALLVPFAHLYFVDTVIRELGGVRASVTVDGIAVVVAWVVLVGFAWARTRERTCA